MFQAEPWTNEALCVKESNPSVNFSVSNIWLLSTTLMWGLQHIRLIQQQRMQLYFVWFLALTRVPSHQMLPKVCISLVRAAAPIFVVHFDVTSHLRPLPFQVSYILDFCQNISQLLSSILIVWNNVIWTSHLFFGIIALLLPSKPCNSVAEISFAIVFCLISCRRSLMVWTYLVALDMAQLFLSI